MSELRIPHLVGGPLAGRPAPLEWVEDRVDHERARFAEYLYADPPEGTFQDIPIAISRADVHEYIEESVTIGGRHSNVPVVEHGVESQGIRALVHKPIHNKQLHLIRAVFELAESALPPRPAGDPGVHVLGYPAHLILRGPDGQTVEVKDWMHDTAPGDAFVTPGVNIQKVANVVHDEQEAGRW